MLTRVITHERETIDAELHGRPRPMYRISMDNQENNQTEEERVSLTVSNESRRGSRNRRHSTENANTKEAEEDNTDEETSKIINNSRREASVDQQKWLQQNQQRRKLDLDLSSNTSDENFADPFIENEINRITQSIKNTRDLLNSSRRSSRQDSFLSRMSIEQEFPNNGKEPSPTPERTKNLHTPTLNSPITPISIKRLTYISRYDSYTDNEHETSMENRDAQIKQNFGTKESEHGEDNLIEKNQGEHNNTTTVFEIEDKTEEFTQNIDYEQQQSTLHKDVDANEDTEQDVNASQEVSTKQKVGDNEEGGEINADTEQLIEQDINEDIEQDVRKELEEETANIKENKAEQGGSNIIVNDPSYESINDSNENPTVNENELAAAVSNDNEHYNYNDDNYNDGNDNNDDDDDDDDDDAIGDIDGRGFELYEQDQEREQEQEKEKEEEQDQEQVHPAFDNIHAHEEQESLQDDLLLEHSAEHYENTTSHAPLNDAENSETFHIPLNDANTSKSSHVTDNEEARRRLSEALSNNEFSGLIIHDDMEDFDTELSLNKEELEIDVQNPIDYEDTGGLNYANFGDLSILDDDVDILGVQHVPNESTSISTTAPVARNSTPPQKDDSSRLPRKFVKSITEYFMNNDSIWGDKKLSEDDESINLLKNLSVNGSSANKRGQSKAKLSEEVLDLICEFSDIFLENQMNDLADFAQHGKRKTINVNDIIFLMQRSKVFKNGSNRFGSGMISGNKLDNVLAKFLSQSDATSASNRNRNGEGSTNILNLVFSFANEFFPLEELNEIEKDLFENSTLGKSLQKN